MLSDDEKKTLLARGLTHLMIACKDNDLTEIKKLLADEDINVNEYADNVELNESMDTAIYPALIYAIDANSIDAVKLLLEHGANPNIPFTLPNDFGENDFEDTKTDQNDETMTWTPVIFAARRADLEITKLLISHGADVTYEADHYCCTIGNFAAWEAAYYANRPDVGRYCLEKALEISEIDDEQVSMVFYQCALLNLNNSCLDLLTHTDADVNFDDDQRMSALFSSVSSNNFELFTILLEHGAEIVDRGYDGKGLLAEAASSNNDKVIDVLLNNEQYINNDWFENELVYSMLWAYLNNHMAAFNKLFEFHVAYQLKHKTIVTNEDGQTLLMLVCQLGFTDVADQLLAIELPDTAQHMLILADHYGETALMKACEYGRIDIVNKLLAYPLSEQMETMIHLTNQDGQTALMKACQRNKIHCINQLLAASFATAAYSTDKNGNTPLMLACYYNATEVVEALLNLGVDINAVNNKGYSALDIITSATAFNSVTLHYPHVRNDFPMSYFFYCSKNDEQQGSIAPRMTDDYSGIRQLLTPSKDLTSSSSSSSSSIHTLGIFSPTRPESDDKDAPPQKKHRPE